MNGLRVVIIGGGAAGFFAAITCAEATPGATVTVLEKARQPLAKVRISGGGRCNVTHACFDPREFASHFPRGDQELIGPFQRFQAADTIAWFESRGVRLKTESDGRMFPVTDMSQTIIDSLLGAAQAAGVTLRTGCGVDQVSGPAEPGPFQLTLATGETLLADRLLLATGGCRTAAGGRLAVALGHTLEPPVPSLFTFHISLAWLRSLAGITLPAVEASVPGTDLRDCGPFLITHEGVSGPVILRLSAWGARRLHEVNYRFPLHVNWLPGTTAETITAELLARRADQPAKLVVNSPLTPLPARLWEQLVLAAGVARETRWSNLGRPAQQRLVQQLRRTELPVTGKSLNRDEFVTCGGVRLSEVNFKTMESRRCPGLYLAGELLDIDGLTGGYNFQAAWTTGWLAGRAMGGV